MFSSLFVQKIFLCNQCCFDGSHTCNGVFNEILPLIFENLIGIIQFSGFTSRPGTPTPFGNAQAGGTELFSNPQPQAGGFSMGSGVTSRPTARGRRRVPRR